MELNLFLATFQDKLLEWKYRKYISAQYRGLIQVSIIVILIMNAIIGWQEYIIMYVANFPLFEDYLYAPKFLVGLRLSAIFVLLACLIIFMVRGLTHLCYRLGMLALILSVALPLFRFYFFNVVHTDLITVEQGMLTFGITVIIRSLFLHIPFVWVSLINLMHGLLFLILALNYDNVYLSASERLHLIIYTAFIASILLSIYQYNLLLRKSYYERYIARINEQKAHDYLSTIEHVEKAFLTEVSSQVLVHELKNPLSVMNSYVQLLQSDSHSLTSEQNMTVSEMAFAVDSMKHIITSIRDFSDGGMHMKPQALKTMIQDSESLWTASAQRYNSSVKISGHNPTILCDKHLMQSAISNLIRNAVEAKKDGFVSVYILEDEHNGVIIIENDNRINISLSKMFKIFKTGHKQTNNSGIGLPLSRVIIEKHEGHINCHTAQKKTTFTVHIPLYKENT